MGYVQRSVCKRKHINFRLRYSDRKTLDTPTNFSSLLSYDLAAQPFNQTSSLNDGDDKSAKLCLTKTNLTTAFVMLMFCLSLAVAGAAALLFFICRCGRKPEPRRYVVRNDSTLTLNSAGRGLTEAPKF
uniref:Uncharacterized protein n=1 Tax=Romanomermis culicivorax TaxID=13658 RepID=A0A915JFA5_ROMCU